MPLCCLPVGEHPYLRLQQFRRVPNSCEQLHGMDEVGVRFVVSSCFMKEVGQIVVHGCLLVAVADSLAQFERLLPERETAAGISAGKIRERQVVERRGANRWVHVLDERKADLMVGPRLERIRESLHDSQRVVGLRERERITGGGRVR